MRPVNACMQIVLYSVKGAIICLYTYRHVHKILMIAKKTYYIVL